MICYESTFPQLNRHFILNGAEILIYIPIDRQVVDTQSTWTIKTCHHKSSQYTNNI